MDALQTMLVSLLIGASVSTGSGTPVTVAPSSAPTAVVSAASEEDPAAIFARQQAEWAAKQTPTPSPVPVSTPIPVITPTPGPTKAAAKASSSSSSSRLGRELAHGSEGNDVRMLQQLLKDLNYSVSVDGKFGKRTREAVREFQQNNGLKADGIAGSRTIRKLTGGDAVAAGSTGNQRGTLSFGMTGQDVVDLQTRLMALGYFNEKCTGNYLTKTREAVRWFQEANGLKVDGIAGPSTLSLLHSGSAVTAGQRSQTATTTNASPAGFHRTLSQGMSGADVSYLQQLLKNLHYFSENITGYFGTATYSAVALFQSYNGLKADGIAGSETQQMLVAPSAVFHPGNPGVSAVQQTGTSCPSCGMTYTSAQAGQHALCIYCLQPACLTGGVLCPSPLNYHPNQSCVYR